MDYSNMTVKQLKEAASELMVDVEATTESGKPSKDDYINALQDFDKEQGFEEEPKAEIENVELEPEIEVKKDKKLTAAQKRSQLKRKQFDELMVLKRVIITSNQENQTKDPIGAVRYVTWGNGLIGHKTDRYILGKPWHIRQGALNNLKEATLFKSQPNPSTGAPETVEVPFWNIQTLDPLSKDELKKMGEKQKVRDAALDAQTY
jgi:hypothetical protein